MDCCSDSFHRHAIGAKLMRFQLLFIIVCLLTVFIANRSMNDFYSGKIDHLTSEYIWLNEESYYGGCQKAREHLKQTFAKSCVELTTDSLMRDELTLKLKDDE